MSLYIEFLQSFSELHMCNGQKCYCCKQFFFVLNFWLKNKYWEILLLLLQLLYSYPSKTVSSSSDLFFLAPFYVASFSRSSSHMCAWNYFLLFFISFSLPKYLHPAILFFLRLHRCFNFLDFLCMLVIRSSWFLQIYKLFWIWTYIPSSQ